MPDFFFAVTQLHNALSMKPIFSSQLILISSSFFITSNLDIFNKFSELFATIGFVQQVLRGDGRHLSSHYKYLPSGYSLTSGMHFPLAKYSTRQSIKSIGEAVLQA